MDKIKERCGVLAYIADRRINKDYGYLLKAYDEKGKDSIPAEIQRRIELRLSASRDLNCEVF